MTEKMTLEENQEFADMVLLPLLSIIETAINHFDIERLRESHKAMQRQLSTMQALPFQEAMDKAEITEAMNNLYSSILSVIEARIEQHRNTKELANRPSGQDILSAFGL